MPTFADIWKYMNPAVGTGLQKGQGAPGWTEGYYTTETDRNGENAQQVWHPGTFDVSKMGTPDKYAGMLTGFDNSGENAQSGPSGQSQLKFNTALMDAKLPDTKFGKFSQTGLMSLGAGKDADLGMLGDQHMGNPNAKYYDENYGWITPSKNVIENRHFTDTFADTIMPMIASAGFGGIASAAMLGNIPGLMSSVVGAAKNYGSGGDVKGLLMSILPSIVGANIGGGNFIPPELAKFLQYAKTAYGGYNAVKSHNAAGMAGGGMSLAQLIGR